MWVWCMWILLYIVFIVSLARLTTYWISTFKENQEIVLDEENELKEFEDAEGQIPDAILGFISEEINEYVHVHEISA